MTPVAPSAVITPGVGRGRAGEEGQGNGGVGNAVDVVDIIDGILGPGAIAAGGKAIGMFEEWGYLGEFTSVDPESFVNLWIGAAWSWWDGRHGQGGEGFVVADGGREVDMVGRVVGKRSTENG